MDIASLPWLPEAGPNFRAEVKQLRATDTVDFGALRKLSTRRLDLTQLGQLAHVCDRAAAQFPQRRMQLRVLSNCTMDLLLPAIAGSAPRHGLLVNSSLAPYGSWLHEALDAESATRTQPADAVLLALDRHAFDHGGVVGDDAAALGQVDAAWNQLLAAVGAMRAGNIPLVIVQTVAEPPEALFGHLDGQVAGTGRWFIQHLNQRIRAWRASGVLVLDVAAIAAQVGVDRWHDSALWNLGKIPMAAAAMPLYADHVCRLLMSVRGLAKKCLVLDLDNTVWGGVIGDDGMRGIKLSNGDAVGEAHLAVQAAALALRARGVVLAVSSKNDDAVARQPFREHADMLLREQHIAVFQANWQDKASNLRAIAQTLNIGIDALVLLDDNPSERHQVRAELPEVGVPELPDTPEDYARILMSAGYFEAVSFTAEDRVRAAQYQDNAARNAMLGEASNLDDHLKSLQMQAFATPFDEAGRARIAQLINKTNQFNLTTRRRTESEVAALETDPDSVTLQVRLKDRFGDNGMICVVIGKVAAATLHLDTWLMSCRVLNRQVERAVLNILVQESRRRGLTAIVGEYRPSDKNGMVKDHYRKLGFTPLATDGTGDDPQSATLWQLDLGQFVEHPTHLEVVRAGAPEGFGA